MNAAQFFSKLKLSPTDAEIIFDHDEPVGRATDMVMPRRRWFGKSKAEAQVTSEPIRSRGRSGQSK